MLTVIEDIEFRSVFGSEQPTSREAKIACIEKIDNKLLQPTQIN